MPPLKLVPQLHSVRLNGSQGHGPLRREPRHRRGSHRLLRQQFQRVRQSDHASAAQQLHRRNQDLAHSCSQCHKPNFRQKALATRRPNQASNSSPSEACRCCIVLSLIQAKDPLGPHALASDPLGPETFDAWSRPARSEPASPGIATAAQSGLVFAVVARHQSPWPARPGPAARPLGGCHGPHGCSELFGGNSS